MIEIAQALEIILSKVNPLAPESVSLGAALGRVLSEPVYAKRNLPPKDNSAMDGYAFRHVDVGLSNCTLRVIEEIPAGYDAKYPLGPGEASKIMTGAPIPQNADTVVPIEEVKAEGDKIILTSIPKLGSHVRKAGEDVRAGDVAIPGGIKIRPQEVGMLASLGRSFVNVHQKPRVAILSTGDEIVEIDQNVDGDKIINSNSHGLRANVIEAGAEPVLLGIGRDNPEELLKMLERARGCDIVISTGGVSMGDYDFMGEVLQKWGASIEFWKVSIKPGKPILFATKGSTLLFGLPGNPVSALVSFEQFVRPAIRKLLGLQRFYRPTVKARIAGDAGRVAVKEGRTEFVRCKVEIVDGEYQVTSVKRRDTGRLSTLVEANALMVITPGQKELNPGDSVLVQLYDYEFLEGDSLGW